MSSNHETFAEEYLCYYALSPADAADGADGTGGKLLVKAHAGATAQGDECGYHGSHELDAVCEQLHDLTTDAAHSATAFSSSVASVGDGVEGGMGGGGVETRDGNGKVEARGARTAEQGGEIGERVRAMLAARARRGLVCRCVYLCLCVAMCVCVCIHSYLCTSRTGISSPSHELAYSRTGIAAGGGGGRGAGH